MPFDGTSFEMPATVIPERRDAVLRALIKARALLNEGWTRGQPFRDDTGRDVEPQSATRYCILGALAKATGSKSVYSPHALAQQVYRFNDIAARDKTDVLRVFDRAIENHTLAWFRWMPVSSTRQWTRALTEISAAIAAA